MSKSPKYPSARWFSALGKCMACSNPATGHLMSFRNDKIGLFCQRHGEAEVRAAQAHLDREKKS